MQATVPTLPEDSPVTIRVYVILHLGSVCAMKDIMVLTAHSRSVQLSMVVFAMAKVFFFICLHLT